MKRGDLVRLKATRELHRVMHSKGGNLTLKPLTPAPFRKVREDQVEPVTRL